MKKFYTFAELEKILGCKQDFLINLAIEGFFPVFIAANSWYAHLWKKPIPSDDTFFDNNPDIEFGELVRATPLEKPFCLNNHLLELKTDSLISYLLNTTASVGSFIADYAPDAPEGFYFEYRLCDPANFSKPYEINLKDHKLIVMDKSLEKLKKLVQDESNNSDVQLTDNERKKLLRIIGLLSITLAKENELFKANQNPNVSKLSADIFDTLDKIEAKEIDIKKSGLSDTTLRETITKGLAELLIETQSKKD
jgi:hypothetical protein